MDHNKITDVELGLVTKNNKDTINTTLKIIKNQTIQPDRLIVVDDSNDGTYQIIQEYCSKNDLDVELIRQPKSCPGVGAARNIVYNEFNADLLIWLDTNIRVSCDWIELLIEFFNNNSKYDILSCVPTDGKESAVSDPASREFFWQSQCAITKNALESVRGWDSNFRRGEDWDIQIRLWNEGIKSFATNSLYGEPIIYEGRGDMLTMLKKTLHRPSSALYLKKYGFRYISLRPLHVIGDLVSLSTIVAILLTFIIKPKPIAVIFFATILFATHVMFFLKWGKNYDLREYITSIGVFLLLGLTFLHKLIYIGEDFNYNGWKSGI